MRSLSSSDALRALIDDAVDHQPLADGAADVRAVVRIGAQGAADSEDPELGPGNLDNESATFREIVTAGDDDALRAWRCFIDCHASLDPSHPTRQLTAPTVHGHQSGRFADLPVVHSGPSALA